MRFRITWLLLCALVVSGVASAQSLAGAARKERERREKNKEQGVAAREYSETQIFGDDEDSDENENDSDARSGEPSGGVSDPSSRPGGRIDVDIAQNDSDSVEDDSQGRQLEEAEWRTRFQEARQRVVRAREQKQILDGVHHVEGMKMVDDNGNVIVENLDDLRGLVAEASQELTEAEKAVKDLEEEARRAGVPPGWRR